MSRSSNAPVRRSEPNISRRGLIQGGDLLRLPIPIRAARKVGEVLKYLKEAADIAGADQVEKRPLPQVAVGKALKAHADRTARPFA